MQKLQETFPERRDELVKLLGINLEWRMFCLSDGQRRRVQLMLCLLRPFGLLLLDEVTTSLDVCVRQDLLVYLLKEVAEAKAVGRPCSIIYATHIFDGLDDWATHLVHLNDTGKCAFVGKTTDCGYYQELSRVSDGAAHPDLKGGRMLALAEKWLRSELTLRRQQRIGEEPEFRTKEELMESKVDPTSRQGGYASGRGIPMEVLLRGQGQMAISKGGDKISNLRGNKGKMLAHS